MANKEFDNVQLFAEYDSTVGSNVVNVFGNKSKENIAYSLSKIKNWFPWLVPTNGSAGQILEWYNNVPTWRVNTNASTVKQTHSTDTDFHPLVLGAPHSASAWSGAISETTDQVYMNKGIYVKPSTSTIYATDYRGKINGFSLIGTEGSTYNLNSFITSQFISSITTTGNGNGVTAIGVNNGVMTVTKGSTFSLDGHSHPLSIATDTGNSQLSMSANTKYKLTAGGSTFIFTTPLDSDTKVTSSANHYTPATASDQDKTASASGATAAWSIDVVKGVTLNTDGKGHVTGISVTSGKIPGNPVPSNNVTGSGTSGYLTKWSGTNTITNGPQLGSSTTTFLRNDGTWTTPVNSGTANCIAYYSGANAISSAAKVTYVNANNSASTPATVAGLHIESPTYGNTAANMIGGVAGVFSYGDGGPQIRFKDGSSTQAGALIFTADDAAASGTSWHFVSNETDWNVISKRFHAKTSISIGTDKPSTSYNLTVNGTSYFDNTITIKGTSSGNASIYYASYGNTRNSTSIRFYDGDVNGQGIQIGGGGLTVLGGGESAQAVFDNLSTLGWNASSEVAVVASDGPIYFMTNCDTFANRKSINIDTTGYLNTGYINMNVSDQDNLFSTASSIVYSNSDKYLRRVSLTKLGSLLGPLVIQDYLPSYGYRSASGFTYLQTSDDFGGTEGARNNPDNHYAHYLIANHGNGQTYYHYTLRLPFWSTPQYQRKTGGSTETENRTRWFNFLTEETGAAKPNYCAFPTDGFYSASASTVTGAMVITLPIGFTAIMLQFTVEIFNYITNKSCMYRISGYVYDVDSKWYSVTATCISGYGYDSNAHRAHNLKVRFGRNSTSGKAQIQIGEISTIWDWPGVQIRDVLMTHNTVQFDTISQGWSITFQSSANIDNVSNTVDSDYVATYANVLKPFAGNEINFSDLGQYSNIWFGYRMLDPSGVRPTYSSAPINAYMFGNGNVDGNTSNLADIYAKTIYARGGSVYAGYQGGGDNVLPSYGYHIYDLRNATVTPAMADHCVQFYFSNADMPDYRWFSVIHVRGWNGSYNTWQLAGPAHNSDQRTTPLYVRSSNTSSTWGSWRKIYDSSNVPTASELGFGTIVTHAAGDYIPISAIDISNTTNLGLDGSKNAFGYISGLTKATWNYQQTDGFILRHFYNASWKFELYADYRTGRMSVRGKNNGTWQAWRRVATIEEATNSKSKTRNVLLLAGPTVGNNASDMISGTAGLFSYGDGGPQIVFSGGDTLDVSGGQSSALIWTADDAADPSAPTGVSWHFVSDQGDWNVTSKRFHARTAITIGTDKPVANSYNLYVTGNGYFSTGITSAGFSTTGANKGYRAYDQAGTQYAIIYDNGSNLWVGAEASNVYHHKGQTYISSGWTGTLPTTANQTLTGNPTIFISVPKYTTNAQSVGSWNHTPYSVLHSGNYTDYTVTKTGTGASGTWAINASGYSNTVYGIYTGNGGVQAPNYFGKNRVGFLMSNVSITGDTHYKNIMYMDCYSGTDVGGVTALAIDRTEARAWILQSDANRTSWNNTAAIGVFTATPTSGQVVITDGTTGGIKSSGYTIAKSVPSNADFTNTWRGIQDNLTSSSNTTESLSAKQGYLLANGSARDSTKVLKTGDTMSGNLTFGSNVGIVQTQNSGSNYTTTIKWWTGGTDPGTYGPEIGQWNTGGDSTYPGRIIIMPYHKSYSSGSGPWGNTAGLCIEYNHVYIDGTELSKVGHTHNYLPTTTKYAGSDTVGGVANNSYYLGDSTTPSTYKLRYINSNDVTTWTTSSLAATDSIAVIRGTVTDAWTTGHIVTFNVASVGTPFQIGVHDSSELYFYKRYRTASSPETWSGWTKMNAGYADSAGSLIHKTLNSTTINNTAGSFVFGGDALLGGVNDWAGIQVEGNNDRFQLLINGHLLVRQNDDATISAAGWTAWTSCLRPADVSGSGGITVTQNNVTIGSGSTAVTYKGTVTISHSNSITASTSAVFKKFSYDANGHITGTAAVAASDLPSHTHAYLPLSGGTMNTNTSITIPYGTGNIIYDGGSGLSVHAPTNSGWTRGIDYYVGSTWYGGFGANGSGGTFESLYIGKYSDKTVQIDPNNKITTFRGKVVLTAATGISYTGTKAEKTMISFKDNTSDGNGNGIVIGGGGLTIIGGGESASTVAAQYSSGGNEDMYVANDGNVYIVSNLDGDNGWANRKTFTFNTSGDFTGSRYIYASYLNQSSGVENGSFTTSCNFMYNLSTDGFLRKVSASTVGSVMSPILTPYEAKLVWGGTSKANSFSPVDAGICSALGANRLEFAKPAGIKIYRATNGISNPAWSEVSATDAQKLGLFSMIGNQFNISASSTAGTGTAAANNIMMVQINSTNASVYTQLEKFIINVTTGGASGCFVKIKIQSKANDGTNVWSIWDEVKQNWIAYNDSAYVEANTHVPLAGDSGWNVINVKGFITYSWQTQHYLTIQLIFGCTSNSGTRTGLGIINILGYGGNGWICPSNLAKSGHIYTYDTAQNAFFPAEVRVPTQLRVYNDNYGAIFRVDANNIYLLPTNANNPQGSWSSLIPFYISNSTGKVTMTQDAYVGGNLYARLSQRTNKDRQSTANLACTGTASMQLILSTGTMTTGKPMTDGFILDFDWDNTYGDYRGQLFVPNNGNYSMQWRGQTGSTDWSAAVAQWKTLVDSSNFKPYKSITQRYFEFTGAGWRRIMTIRSGNSNGYVINDIKIFVRRQYNSGSPESFSVHIINNYDSIKIRLLHAEQYVQLFDGIRVSKSSDSKYQYIELNYTSAQKNSLSIRYDIISPYTTDDTVEQNNPTYPADGTLATISDSPTPLASLLIPTGISQFNLRQVNGWQGGYFGMADATGGDSAWIRTTSNGLIPYTEGAATTGGNSYLGTSGWYFKEGYISKVYANTIDCEGIAPRHTNEINFKSPGSTLWFAYRIITDDKGSGTTSPSTPINTYLFGCGKANTEFASLKCKTVMLAPGTNGASYAQLTGGTLTATRTINAPDSSGTMSVSSVALTSAGTDSGYVDVPTGSRYLIVEVKIAATSVKSFHKVAIDTSVTSTSLIQTTTKGQYGLQLTIQPIQFVLSGATAITGGTRYLLTMNAGSVMSISAGTTPSAASASPQITKVYAQA